MEINTSPPPTPGNKKKKALILGIVVALYLLVVTPLMLFNAQTKQDNRTRADVASPTPVSTEISTATTAPSALAQCDTSGRAQIGVAYTNADPSRPINVIATDEKTGKTATINAIAAQQTSSSEILTGIASVTNGTVIFTGTFADNGAALTPRTASYTAKSCVPVTQASLASQAAQTTAVQTTAVQPTATTQTNTQVTTQAANQPTTCGNTPTDTVLVTDTSGSMGDQHKIIEAKNAASNFVDIIAQQQISNTLGLVTYATTSTLQSPLTNNFGSIKAKISSLKANGNTCIECAIKKASADISSHGRPGVKKVVVLMTDGIANAIEGKSSVAKATAEQKALAAAAADHAANGTVYFIIGFGSDVNKPFLQKLATDNGGKFYFTAPSQLDTVYQEISQLIGKGIIGGYKFDDKNYNGTYDQGEPYLPGWTIKATYANYTQSVTTDANGYYAFGGLCDGTYQVAEVAQNGWRQTYPANGAGYTVSLTNAAQYFDKNFGNTNYVAPPTATPIPYQPNPTVNPYGTYFSITVFQHGIGSSGDNSNSASSYSNKTPEHQTINTDLQIFDAKNTLFGSGTGVLTYNSQNGNYTGDILITPDGFPSGNYTMKVRTQYHLRKTMEGIQTITSGQKNTNFPAVTLVTGDANNDNKLNILDYNMLLGCYSDLAAASYCNPSSKVAADFNDDRFVNQIDYNLFLREIATQPGQ